MSDQSSQTPPTAATPQAASSGNAASFVPPAGTPPASISPGKGPTPGPLVPGEGEKPLAASYVAEVAPKELPKIAETPVIPDEVGSAKWKESLPDDLKNEPVIGRFKSIEDLARSLVNAQKMLGRDKVTVPDPKHATEKDYQEIFLKLGLPADAKDYKLELAADSGLDQGFLDKIKVKAHELGVLPKQLEKLLGWYSGESKEVMQQHQAKFQEEQNKAHQTLKQEWGKVYEKNVLAAQLAVKDAATPEEVKYLEQRGLTTDTTLLRIFSRLGNMLKEGELKGGNNGGGNLLPPAQAQAEANRIISDFNHPYNKAEHPNHKAAVDEVRRLMDMAHPEPEKE